MTHSAHLFVGPQLEESARQLKSYINRYGEASVAPFFHSLDTAGMDDAVTRRRRLTQFYTETVTINNPGTGKLALTIYCQLYDPEAVKLTTDIAGTVSEIGKNYKVEIIGIHDDLARLFNPKLDDSEQETLSKLAAQGLNQLAGLRQDRMADVVRMVQNVNESGLALNLDMASWIRLIGEYALLRIEKYEDVVSSISRMDTDRPIDAMGLAVMNFDKEYFIDYLHSRAFVEIMNDEKVDCREVSINVATTESQGILEKLREEIRDFYKHNLAPLLTRDHNRSNVIAKVTPVLDKFFVEAENTLTGCVNRNDLSLPEKEAILAMILGTDSELFKDAAIDDTQLSIDDLWTHSINVFIDEANKNGMSEEGPISNPIEQIKRLRTKIRNSTQFVRRKTEELEQKQKILGQQTQVGKRLTENGFQFEGTVYRIDSIRQDEVPLQNTYEPHPVKEKSLDLRSGFTHIKNQGPQGSCGAFAVTSMIEYIIRSSLPEIFNPDLSEAFIYYNARSYEGATDQDCGSSFYQSIRGAMEHGICDESKHPYRAEDFSTPPSQEAMDDAAKRIVTEAKNVNCNIGDIKSAIADGYPVAVSARIFDSFASGNAGFVSMPSEEEKSQQESYHALVVAGFSDEERIFVVRNSWGEQFGDAGYCYIPYSYAEAYFRNAVIITGIRVDGIDANGGAVSTNVVQFNTTDTRIQVALLGLLIDEENKKLRGMHDEYARLRTAYELVVNRFTNPNSRKAISDMSRQRLEAEIAAKKKEESRLYDEGNAGIAAYRKSSIKSALWFTLVSIVSLATWGYLWYNFSFEKWTLITGLVTGGIAAIIWVYRLIRLKVLKRERNERVAAAAEQRGLKETELHDIDMRLHLHGMIIDRLSKLSNNVKNVYDRLSAYIGNLRVWQTEEIKKLGRMEPVKRDPFISIIDNSSLDNYFDKQCKTLVAQMRLCDEFKYFDLSDESLYNVKEHLKSKVNDIIASQASRFMMYSYLSGTVDYPYLPRPLDSQELLPFLMQKSTIFTEPANTDVIGNHTDERRLFMHFPTHEERLKWTADNSRYFFRQPSVEEILSPDKIILFTSRRFTPDEITG